jgi:ribosomal protein S18 acetylase RimI-like enzyme
MIRIARHHHAPVVRDVVDAAYTHYIARIGKPPSPMLDDYGRRIADGQTWVIEDAGRIVGVVVLEETQAGFVLDNVAVLPGCQGKGHGRALVAFAEAEARRRGYDAVHLYTHALMIENIGFYYRLGFIETHRVSEKGYDRVYMTKHLHGSAEPKAVLAL